MATNQDALAPLVDLVNRLRRELNEKVPGTEGRKLALAEATLELLQSHRDEMDPPVEEGASGVKGLGAGPRGSDDEDGKAQEQPLARTQVSERVEGPRFTLSKCCERCLLCAFPGRW
jgi:hypothetical protein